MKFIFILLLFIIVYMPNNSIQGLDEKENVYYGKLMKLLALNSKTDLEKGDPYLTSFDTEDAKKTLTNDTKTSPTGITYVIWSIFLPVVYLNTTYTRLSHNWRTRCWIALCISLLLQRI